MKFALAFLLLAACASKAPISNETGAVAGDLKVSSTTAGHLRAKLSVKNTTTKDVTLPSPTSAAFRVETTDGKAMSYKGSRASGPPVTLKAGEAQEFAFSLQDNYSFWDRRTKYKIWFESPELKSNVVQVWF